MKYVFIVLTLYAGLIGLSNAQELAYPDSFNEPMELFPGAMGDFFFPISSENDLAQAYFNQGFQLMYSFAKEEKSLLASFTKSFVFVAMPEI